jgi:hypothetical protein
LLLQVENVKKKTNDLKADLETGVGIEELKSWGNLKQVGYPTFERTDAKKRADAKKKRKKARKKRKREKKKREEEGEELIDDEAEDEGEDEGDETSESDHEDLDLRGEELFLAPKGPFLVDKGVALKAAKAIKEAAEAGDPVCQKSRKREDKRLADIARMEDRLYYGKKKIERRGRRKEEMDIAKKIKKLK